MAVPSRSSRPEPDGVRDAEGRMAQRRRDRHGFDPLRDRGPLRGLGDLIERILHVLRIGPWYKRLRRGRCRCGERRRTLNRWFPFGRWADRMGPMGGIAMYLVGVILAIAIYWAWRSLRP